MSWLAVVMPLTVTAVASTRLPMATGLVAVGEGPGRRRAGDRATSVARVAQRHGAPARRDQRLGRNSAAGLGNCRAAALASSWIWPLTADSVLLSAMLPSRGQRDIAVGHGDAAGQIECVCVVRITRRRRRPGCFT